MINPASDIIVKIFYPAADLQCLVKYYWIVQVKDARIFDRSSQISPSGYPELIFHLGDHISVSTSEGSSPIVSTEALIAGQITQPIHLYMNNHIHSLCVKLQPYAFSVLFKTNSSEFTDRAFSLRDILPGIQKNIYNQLSEANNDHARIGIIENHLRQLLKKNQDHIDPDTFAAINHLKANINWKTGELEQIMGISRRTLQRRLKEHVGISPKTLERIFRFNQAYHLIKHNKNLDMQDISFYLGYYDLPHLINEFKEFTGRSPLNYFKQEDVYNSLFAGIL